MIADGTDFADLDGIQVRKGTVAAWVANAKKLESLSLTDPGYAELAAHLRAEAVKVKATGVFDVLAPRSPRIAEIIDGL